MPRAGAAANKRIVVSAAHRAAAVHDDASETIATRSTGSADVWREIERFAVLDHLVELHAGAHAELKALEVHDERVGRLVDRQALGGRLQRLAALTAVGVVAGEALGLAKMSERGVERGALELETEIEQRLKCVRGAVTVRTLHTRAQLAAPDALDDSAALAALGALEGVDDESEKLVRVLLSIHIETRSKQLEVFRDETRRRQLLTRTGERVDELPLKQTPGALQLATRRMCIGETVFGKWRQVHQTLQRRIDKARDA